MAALAEEHSNHPITKAIKETYGKEVSGSEIKEYEEIAGQGVRTKICGKEIMVGNDRILHKFSVTHDTCDVKETVAHVIVDRKHAGYIVISDEIKEDVPETIEELKKLGVKKIVMLTGDNKEVAEQVAKQMALVNSTQSFYQKKKWKSLRNLKKKKVKKSSIVFVGDGINDALVIARANIGVAMEALGSDVAIEIADVVIMDGKPSRLP